VALITANPSVDLLNSFLQKLGYTSEKLQLGASSYTRFTAPNGATWLTQDAHVSYPFSSAACKKISNEKDLAYEFCEQHGVCVPRTKKVYGPIGDEALAAFLGTGPVVVKPNSSSLSWGVTLNIRDEYTLKHAVIDALSFSRVALVQQQIKGEEIRFTVLGGKVKAALLRQTPRVTGDGIATVGELLRAENEVRSQLKMPYVTYPILDERLINMDDLDMNRVPAEGEVVELGRGTMVKTGASIYNIVDDIHTSYIDVAEKAATALGARFVVVDIMIQDYTVPKTDDNYAFIEFNSAPVLKLFYSCRDGKQYDIISELGPMIDRALREVAA
jgi:D-alanine-D-alanine ligase-like ATP-grasp enzyme